RRLASLVRGCAGVHQPVLHGGVENYPAPIAPLLIGEDAPITAGRQHALPIQASAGVEAIAMSTLMMQFVGPPMNTAGGSANSRHSRWKETASRPARD